MNNFFKEIKNKLNDSIKIENILIIDNSAKHKLHKFYDKEKYHPDKNQGSKKFEDKLKKITLAYSQLKKTLGKK